MDHDTLFVRSCDLTGLSPRTKVCPDDPIQDRGHDTHGRHVCADGHTRTHTGSHRRHVCAYGQPQTATDILCVLADTHGRPMCTEQTAHVGKNPPNSPREGPAC